MSDAEAAAAHRDAEMHLDEEKEGATADMEDTHDSNEPEQKQIMEEYKVWKKNTPFLYDLVVTHALEWPSLTIEWLPEREVPEGKDYTIQRLLLGTHTAPTDGSDTTPPNYLLLGEVRLPSPNAPKKPTAAPAAAAAGEKGDGEEEEEGAYGAHSGKFEIVQQITHQGDVNRARYAPYNPNLIATKSPAAQVFVFDKTKHASKPSDTVFRPDLVLAGHESEGYALAWNPHPTHAGELLSGSDDSLICLWDVESASREKPTGYNSLTSGIAPLQTFRGHKDVVEDVAWSYFTPTQFASCGDDSRLLLWDSRTPAKATNILNDATGKARHHIGNINCVAFNHISPHLFLSGGADSNLHLWDLRRLHEPIHTLKGHKGEVRSCSFAPFSSDIVLSCGDDRRAHVWNLARIGEALPMDEEDLEDGPPELIFTHAGHCDNIADACWNYNLGEEWMIASVADDNILQIWQVAENIYNDDDEEGGAGQANDLHTAPGHDVEEIE